MSSPTSADRPTSRIYKRERLSAYDRWVWGFSFQPWAWGPRADRVVEFYRTHLSRDHLDVGVGTGLLLDRAGMPEGHERLHLLDANQGPLEETAQRLARFSPTITRADALAPWTELEPGTFASVGCMNVVHCLPDPEGRGIEAKTALLDSVARVLRPGGRFFGATLLDRGIAGKWRRPIAPLMMAAYNRLAWFSNRADTAEDLERALAARFDDVHVWTEGSLALWYATARS
ncbi:class I SAM-dependent methyltransferase [Nocardiopsis trehalosi]|jgi:SAM-dependent methyltransferase|uniref:class I SAM-dependent methyltransferase n=1 Tax=Nocardiopsis trehalosi TaxID=109329 RepID=UPI0008357572|nr:class I SAM-dependent methyltransferase [Nocardiopsis trehalosi]